MSDDQNPTHDAGATLDLCFVQSTVIAHYVVRQNLETELDYRTLVTFISDIDQELESPGRLLHAACDSGNS